MLEPNPGKKFGLVFRFSFLFSLNPNRAGKMLELCAQVTFPFTILFLVDVVYQYSSRILSRTNQFLGEEFAREGGNSPDERDIQNAMENKIGTLIMISKIN